MEAYNSIGIYAFSWAGCEGGGRKKNAAYRGFAPENMCRVSGKAKSLEIIPVVS